MKRLVATLSGLLMPVIARAAPGQALGDTGGDFTYQNLVKIVTELVKILLEIGELCAVMAVVFYGLQMVLSRGDATKFASARKGLGLALVGALVIFGVYTIIATVQGGVDSVGN